jgi:hypothetical protein
MMAPTPGSARPVRGSRRQLSNQGFTPSKLDTLISEVTTYTSISLKKAKNMHRKGDAPYEKSELQ